MVLLAAGKALMIKDMSNNLYLFIKETFSSCKSFEACEGPSGQKSDGQSPEKSVHIRVLPPSARRLRNKLRHQSGKNLHYRLPYTFYIFYIPKLSKREVISTFSSPAEEKHDGISYTQTVERLLENGGFADAADNHKCTPLSRAAASGHILNNADPSSEA